MSNKVNLTITSDLAPGTLASYFSEGGKNEAVTKMVQFLQGMKGGQFAASISTSVNEGDADYATKTVTLTSVISGDQLLINGVAFEAGVDFTVGTDAATATSLAEAINASEDALIDGIVEAEASEATVIITAVTKGASGNSVTLQSVGTASISIPGEGEAATGTLICTSVVDSDTAVINGTTLTAVDKKEATTITCVADQGEFEQTTITCVADQGEFEQTTITCVADTGAFEEVVVNVPSTAAAAQGDYFILTDTGVGTKEAFWLDIDADGTAPVGAAFLAADIQTEVDIVTGGTAIDNAAALVLAFLGQTGYAAVDNLDGTVTFTQTLVGNVTNAAKHNFEDTGDGSFTFSGEVNGAASNLNDSYFTFSNANDAVDYYAWYNVNGEGTDPAVASTTGIEVAIAAGATDSDVASATRTALAAAADMTITGATNQAILTNDLMGPSTDTADGAAATGFTINKDNDGVASNLLDSYFTFSNANDATDYYAWYNVNGEGTDPAVASTTGIEVAIAAGATDSAVASATRSALAAAADMTITGATNQAILTNDLMGPSTDTTDGAAATGFTINKDNDGVASNLLDSYFTFSSASDATDYYIWYNVNGEGTDPAVASTTGVEVAIDATDSANDVAAATRAVFLSAPLSADFDESGATNEVVFRNKLIGTTTDAADGAAATGFTIAVDVQGGAVGSSQFQIGDTDAASASALNTLINGHASLTMVTSSVDDTEVTVRATEEGIEGNNITLAGTGGVAAGAARLSGGTDDNVARLSGGADTSTAITLSFGV